MTSRSIFSLFFVTLFGITSGCNDRPSDVGSEFIDGDLEVVRIYLEGNQIDVESGIAVVSNSSNQLNDAVLFGTADDGIRAHGLFNLVEHSARLQNITPDEILRAELRFQTVGYRYGEIGSGATGFDVVYFDGTFGNAAQFTPELQNRLEAGTVLASIVDRLPDSSLYRIELARNEATSFLNGYYDLDTVDNGTGGTSVVTNTLLSLGLRANGTGSTIASILGASVQDFADSLMPSLIVTLADTVITLEMGVSNWIVSYPDDIQTGVGNPMIAAGAPIRTLLTFPIDTIPETALILKAELTMYVAEGSERTGTTGTITNVLAYIAGDDPLQSPSRLATFPEDFGPVFARGFRPAADTSSLEDRFRFPGLNGAITNWLKYRRSGGAQGYANNGVIISLGRSQPDLESATVDRLAFVGSAGPEGRRPRLEITYAVPANQVQ
jgi:hypothetical protein